MKIFGVVRWGDVSSGFGRHGGADATVLVGTVAALPFSHDRVPRSVLEWCPVKLVQLVGVDLAPPE